MCSWSLFTILNFSAWGLTDTTVFCLVPETIIRNLSQKDLGKNSSFKVHEFRDLILNSMTKGRGCVATTQKLLLFNET